MSNLNFIPGDIKIMNKQQLNKYLNTLLYEYFNQDNYLDKAISNDKKKTNTPYISSKNEF